MSITSSVSIPSEKSVRRTILRLKMIGERWADAKIERQSEASASFVIQAHPLDNPERETYRYDDIGFVFTPHGFIEPPPAGCTDAFREGWSAYFHPDTMSYHNPHKTDAQLEWEWTDGYERASRLSYSTVGCTCNPNCTGGCAWCRVFEL